MKPLALLTILFAAACATSGTGPSTSIEADGPRLRHLRVRIVPEQTKRFEELMKACVECAGNDSAPWLCYREPPGHYWLIQVSPQGAPFPYAEGLQGFVTSVTARSTPARRDALLRQLSELRYETRWSIVTQQVSSWSTVDRVNPKTHGKARIMMREVKPGMLTAFAKALTERTALFDDIGHPLPIVGYATLSGAASRQFQVVFAEDWGTFHDRQSFGIWAKTLPPSEQDRYAARKAALMRTMNNAAWFDGTYADELSLRR